MERYRIRGKLPIAAQSVFDPVGRKRFGESGRRADCDRGRAARGSLDQRPPHAIARHEMPDQTETAEQETRPYRDAEIKRHPGNLIPPPGEVVRDDPAAR